MINDLQIKYPVLHSNHSSRRAAQRGINNEYIQVALSYSVSWFKQGLIFHVVLNKAIPKDIDPRIRKKIKNMVIIIAGDSNTIITCYRAKKAMHAIKKKSKVLKKYTNAA